MEGVKQDYTGSLHNHQAEGVHVFALNSFA